MPPQIMTGIPFQVICHTTFLWLSEMFSKHTKFSIHTREGAEQVCLDSLKKMLFFTFGWCCLKVYLKSFVSSLTKKTHR